jgi:hypothetical protein
MSYPPQGTGGTGDATLANQTTLLTRLSAARAGYLDELAAANLPTDVGNLLTRLSAARAGYLDHLNRDRPDMIFPSVASAGSIVVLPAVAADLDFPDVVVSGLPSGLSIARADFILVIGALFDTSASENQIDQADKTIRVKLSTGSWGTDDIVALTFANNGLQVDGDAYRGGVVLFGATDIKSVVTADGTYNFRSEETNRSEGVTVTGASLEALDVASIIRVWFN